MSPAAPPPASPRLRARIAAAGPGSGDRDAPPTGERCELCGLPVAPEHRHLVDLERRQLLCACRACAVLFDHEAAGGRRYRLVPDRLVRLDGLRLDDLAWRSLGLPVEMAFFLRAGDGRVTAFYPSPAGATESELELAAWDQIEAANPVLAELRPDVEALLVNRVGDAREAYLAGVDVPYRLVALVRTHWRGLGGGDELWRGLAAFFDDLRARAERRP